MIGGAERLVVDAALGLQALGHSVDIYTSHHDPGHSFDETNNGANTISPLTLGVIKTFERHTSDSCYQASIPPCSEREIPYTARPYPTVASNQPLTSYICL